MGASASTVSANTEFTVLVKVTANTGVCFIKAVVEYDPSVLTYVSGSSDTTVFQGATLQINHNAKQSKVIVALGGMAAFTNPNPTIYTQTGEFVSLKFKVKEDAPAGKTTITLTTEDGDVVITKDSVPNYNFDITNASASVTVTNTAPHTCVAGTAIKENEVAATCTVDGSYDSVVKCTICNAELKREKVTTTKLGHKESGELKENETPATCLSVGKYDSVVRCTVCNAIISKTTVVVPINDQHTPGTAVKENEKAGDCKNPGSYDSVVYCTVCSKEISRKTETGAKGTHTPGVPEVNYVESTCTKKGSITEISKCTACGTVLDKKVSDLDLADHIKSAPVKENVVEATCTKSGSYLSVVKCATCDTRISSEVVQVDKIPHTPAAAVEENRKEPANCGAAGSYDSVVYCTVCKGEVSRVAQAIPAPAHTPGPEATETTAQICTVCNTVLVPAHGHTHHWGTALVGDSTGHWIACTGCSEKKDFTNHNYDNNCDATCNDCGTQRTPGDHAYGPWTTVKEPTTTEEGKRERTCIVCNYTDIDTVPVKVEETTTAPETTLPETTEEPEASTDPQDTEKTPDESTKAPDATTEPDNTTEPKKEKGCRSTVSMGIAFIAILGRAIILKKRD